MLLPNLLDGNQVQQGHDFKLAPQLSLVHQAHLNAFVPPASRDWHAYEWQPGDYVCHFAGCPIHEPECRAKMEAMAAQAAQPRLEGQAPGGPIRLTLEL